MLVYMIFALMTAYVTAQQTPYMSCITPDAVSNYYVTGCTSSPCVFQQGGNIHAKITWTPPFDSPTAPLKITITIDGKVVAEGVASGDFCDYMTPKCPVKKGTKYIVEYTLPANLPKGTGTIKGFIDNPQGQRIFCQSINVKIE